MNEKNVLFEIGCEAGTYIRKLCHDIGEVLGCGAHMQEPRGARSETRADEGHGGRRVSEAWPPRDLPAGAGSATRYEGVRSRNS